MLTGIPNVHFCCFVIYIFGFLIGVIPAGAQVGSVTPPAALGGNRLDPSIASVAIPKTAQRYPPETLKDWARGRGGQIRGPQMVDVPLPQMVDVPLEPAKVFASLRLDKELCVAVTTLIQATSLGEECSGLMTNRKQTVTFEITNCQGNNKACEFQLYGESADIALGDPNWVERHRFFVQTVFDGREDVSLWLLDFEPMLRTTPELTPVNERLFDYIPRSYDTQLPIFQNKVQQEIKKALQAAFAR